MALSIKKEVLELLKKDDEAILAVAKTIGKRFRTGERWINENDSILTLDAIKDTISKFVNIPVDELTEEAEPFPATT